MATNYPGGIQDFTDPTATDNTLAVDHADQHTKINDTVSAIQTTVGTTAGTNVLMNFQGGQFPLRINSGGTLLDVMYAGTLNTSTLIGNTYIGGTMNSAVFSAGTAGTIDLIGGTLTLPQIKTFTTGSAVYSGTNNGTTTVNLSTATRHLVNMPATAGSLKIELSNVTANQPFIIEVKQGTAGLGTVVWFSTISWAGSAAPSLTTSASRKDTFGFIATGTATFDGFIVGQNI